MGNQRHPSRSVVTWMIRKRLKEHSSLSSEFTLQKKLTPFIRCFLYSTAGSDHAGFTSERMDGEGLVGLNDVHLELKINGAAARQRDAASNAAGREKIKSFNSNA